jgi:cell division protein ZapA
VRQDQPGVKVSIMGKEFMVACPEEEKTSLVAAAKYLDHKMKDIHNSGKVLGAERCAIMAALNIANELLQYQNEGVPADMGNKIKALQAKIDNALRDSAQLSL